MVTRAITEDVRDAWRVLRGELRRRRPSPSAAMRGVEAALREGREAAGVEEGTKT